MTPITLDLRRPPSGALSPANRRSRSGSAGRSRDGVAAALFIAAFLLCGGITLNGIGFAIKPGHTGRALVPLPTEAANQQIYTTWKAFDEAATNASMSAADQELVDAMQTLREKLVQVTRLAEKGVSTEDTQLPSSETPASGEVSTDKPLHRSIQRADDVKEIQKQLASLGYFAGPVVGVWGPRSRDALRIFKDTNSLPANIRWDEDTEAVLFGGNAKEADFSGTWAVDVESCSTFPVILQKSGAKAGDTSCVFAKTRRTMGGWDIPATCSNARERWTTQVRLAINGSKLTWTSQRGTETYLRCDAGVSVASAR
jgi:Putative peptidoglycan binding domain